MGGAADLIGGPLTNATEPFSHGPPRSWLLPPSFAMRAPDRVDHALDREALVEVDGQRVLAGDAVQKLVRLDDLEVVEAQLVAGRGINRS